MFSCLQAAVAPALEPRVLGCGAGLCRGILGAFLPGPGHLCSLQAQLLPWQGHPRDAPRGGGCEVPVLRVQATPKGRRTEGRGRAAAHQPFAFANRRDLTQPHLAPEGDEKKNKKNLRLKRQAPTITKGGRDQEPRLPPAAARGPRCPAPPEAAKGSARLRRARPRLPPARPRRPPGPAGSASRLVPAAAARPARRAPDPTRRLLPARPRGAERGCAGETIEGPGGLRANLRAPGMDGEVCAAPGSLHRGMGL